MARKGLSSSNGTCLSCSMFITTKYNGKINFPTLMSTSSKIPSGCTIYLSTICKVIVVGVSSPKLGLFTTDNIIKLMFVLESHKALPNSMFPMMQGMVKLPGSYIFIGKLLCITAM